jgi:D-threo-aldose 1-dehydrogenase
VNRIEPVELLLGLTGVKPDGTLLAGRYTLLDHENIRRHPEIVAKVERIKALAHRHALQFSLGHPASAAVIPGASRPERITEDHAALKAVIPADFWREMRKQELVAANAPPPIDR